MCSYLIYMEIDKDILEKIFLESKRVFQTFYHPEQSRFTAFPGKIRCSIIADGATALPVAVCNISEPSYSVPLHAKVGDAHSYALLYQFLAPRLPGEADVNDQPRFHSRSDDV
mmetsp:Transcript_3004/g.6246  ORF Transcript_3004/g.6246 Transcript_3004/m.6246 type:complete len:113 (-) Transcript_3004:689-1027(-)